MPLLFVYGTLKRGCKNHHHLAGQTFLAEARTTPGFHLHDLGGYPCMVKRVASNQGVTGELWKVDEATLGRLDVFEGVSRGLYNRATVPLVEPSGEPFADAYLYQQDIVGLAELGDTWSE